MEVRPRKSGIIGGGGPPPPVSDPSSPCSSRCVHPHDSHFLPNGDIVVAILEDEEATLKRFYRESNGMIRLQPANSEMEPLFTNRVQLRGVVRGVIRKFR